MGLGVVWMRVFGGRLFGRMSRSPVTRIGIRSPFIRFPHMQYGVVLRCM